MKPPMNQVVIANVPIVNENGEQITDKYGRPKTEKQNSAARVQYRSQVVYDAQGQEQRVNLEIDLPPAFNPPVGSVIEYTTISGEYAQGTIRAKAEATNLAATRIYYRTVYVDG